MEDLYDKVLEQASDDDDKFKFRLMNYHYHILRTLFILGKINSKDLRRYSQDFAEFILQEMSRKD